MSDRPPDEEAIFKVACQIASPDARAAYLNQVCGGNSALLERIGALLQAYEQESRFLESPPPGVGVTMDVSAPSERPGTQIGPYKLLQQIGEGGMGVVYMAEQTEPVQRKVALKVIKPGMDSRQVIARFEAERQALAMMDHVNIARVLDAGTVGEGARDWGLGTGVGSGSASAPAPSPQPPAPTGRPYFVMELVNGVPITKYCDDNRLTPRQRLELFVPVCQAIQHAHQKGIIHRDIKPSNVMVTLYDGKPVPKVIDFGVAKATEQKLTERTLFTQYGTMVGTLEYMSPEQAEMSALGVDTRSDIYSLGVLLYELLTGSTPLSSKQMKEAAYGEILRLIKEEDPPKPSTRLSDSGEALASISAQRQTEPAKLTKLVRGELDWIVMKTLEKDRNRRYETAKDFAADVQRYLNNEAVQACPPSARYRLWKFVRRNKRPVLAALLVVLALVAGIVGTSFGLIQAEQQRLVVEQQRNDLAERNQALEAAHERERLLNERARQAIESVTSDTAIEQLTREQKLSQEQKDFLDKMILYYAESVQEVTATEQERSRQTRAYFQMGRLNQVLGRSQDSEKAYRRVVALGRQLVADFPARPEFQQELALSHNALGALLLATGRSPEAELAYADALAILKQLAANFPTRPEFRQALAGIYNNQGNLLGDTGRLAEAELAHVQALAIRKQLATDFSTRPIIRRALAMSHNNLGWLFQSTERLEKAESSYADAVAAQKLVVADFPNRPDFRQDLTKYQFNLGNLLRDSGRLKEAEAIYGEAMPIQKQLAADFPNRPVFRQELAGGHNKLGILFRNTERLPEAEAAYGEALAINKQLVAEFPDVPEYRNDAAGTLFNLASAANRRQDFDTARKLVDEAIPYHLAALQANPRHIDYRAGYRNSLVELTQSCAGLGDRPAAFAAATKRRDLGWDPAVDAYEAACMLALCVPIVEKDDKLEAAKRQDEIQFYADQAIAMLRDAVAKGFKNIELLKKDEYIGAIRESEEFKKVVAELEATVKKN